MLRSNHGVRVVDCGEPLVELAAHGVAVSPAYFRLGHTLDPRVRVRQGVAERLRRVQDGLPHGWQLLVWDGHRPRALQRVLYDDFRHRLAQRHPHWSAEAVQAELQRFVAPPEPSTTIAPHLTGGAVDLTLVDAAGLELDLGTAFDDFSERAHTGSTDIPAPSRRHREVLVQAMQSQGFTNYPEEWWHWGYGDPLSAALRGEPVACYGAVDDEVPTS